MRKRTPLERYHAWFQKALALGKAAIEADFADTEEMLRVMSDPALSLERRIKALKGLRVWARIVLGLYEEELALAQKRKNENPAQEHGEPSDITYDTVGAALGLGPDRVKDLCGEGRAHLREGLPPKPKTIAEFKRELSTTVPESDAAKYRQGFAEKKKQTLAAFERRFMGCRFLRQDDTP